LVEGYGFLSVIPPLVAIGLAIVTKQVLPSLFLATWLGALFLAKWNPLGAFLDTVQKYVVASISDSWNAAILAFTFVMFGMCGVLARSGGAKAIANWFARRSENPRSGQLATWLMGLIIFIDDYANTMIVGNTMRPLTDRLKISREKLSYIVDTTAATDSSMAIISSWIGYEMGLIRDAFGKLGIEWGVYLTFLRSIPFRFYSIFALILVLFLALQRRDYGPMYAAEVRARTQGKLLRDGASPLVAKEMTEAEPPEGAPLRAYNFIIPIVAVIVIAIVGMWYTGGGAEGVSIMEAIGNSDSSVALLWASVAGSILAIAMVVGQRILTLQEAVDAWVDGGKSVFVACAILVLAWSLGSVCEDLGTAHYIVGITKGFLSPALVPALIFLVCAGISFATGTSWGTMAIVMPLGIPLAYHLGAPMIPTIGAVLTGSVFGDHCSPISDTTILSSLASACDHIDHVTTQLPYALTAAIAAVIVGFIPVGFGLPPYISLAAGLLALWFWVRFFGKPTELEVLAETRTAGE